jgi:hypothetical protein
VAADSVVVAAVTADHAQRATPVVASVEAVLLAVALAKAGAQHRVATVHPTAIAQHVLRTVTAQLARALVIALPVLVSVTAVLALQVVHASADAQNGATTAVATQVQTVAREATSSQSAQPTTLRRKVRLAHQSPSVTASVSTTRSNSRAGSRVSGPLKSQLG